MSSCADVGHSISDGEVSFTMSDILASRWHRICHEPLFLVPIGAGCLTEDSTKLDRDVCPSR